MSQSWQVAVDVTKLQISSRPGRGSVGSSIYAIRLTEEDGIGAIYCNAIYILHIVIRSIQDYRFLKHLFCASTAKGNQQVGQLTECDAM